LFSILNDSILDSQSSGARVRDHRVFGLVLSSVNFLLGFPLEVDSEYGEDESNEKRDPKVPLFDNFFNLFQRQIILETHENAGEESEAE
jgi:hypothetical protein